VRGRGTGIAIFPHTRDRYQSILIRCIQHVGDELEQAIDFNEKYMYCIHKEGENVQMYLK